MKRLPELFRKGSFGLKLSKAQEGGERGIISRQGRVRVGVSPILHAILLPSKQPQPARAPQLAPARGPRARVEGFYRLQGCAGLRKRAPNPLTLPGNAVSAPPLESGRADASFDQQSVVEAMLCDL